MKLIELMIQADAMMIGDYWYHYDAEAIQQCAKANKPCVFPTQENQYLTATMDLNQEVERFGHDENAYVLGTVQFGLTPEPETEIYLYRRFNLFELI